MLESIDIWLFLAVNQFVGTSYLRDNIINEISRNEVFKGLPVFMAWWGLWFAGTRSTTTRIGLLTVVVTSMIAIIVGRLLAMVLPFRLRPIHDPELGAITPYGISAKTLQDWSSMPSDNAVFFFSLAVGMFLVHRLAGKLLIFHAILIISLPRIYMGVHYPGDILAGAAIGALMAVVLFRPVKMAIEKSGVMRLEADHPGFFYAALFLITFQSASMFESARVLLQSATTALKTILGA
jgi:undecaprenyl-diphosphatase